MRCIKRKQPGTRTGALRYTKEDFDFGRSQEVALSTWAEPGFSEGGSDKCPPIFSNCYCCLTSPFFTRNSMVKIFVFVSL